MTKSLLLYHKNFQDRMDFSADVVQVTQRLGTKPFNLSFNCLKYSVNWLSFNELAIQGCNGGPKVDTSRQDDTSLVPFNILGKTLLVTYSRKIQGRSNMLETVRLFIKKPLSAWIKGDIWQGTVTGQKTNITTIQRWKIKWRPVHKGSKGKHERS